MSIQMCFHALPLDYIFTLTDIHDSKNAPYFYLYHTLYKDPSGEVNLDFFNMTTNLSGTHSKGSDVGKKVTLIICV